MVSGRTRDANGRFVCCDALAGRASLEKHRIRQRKFLARRVRERKRITSTFFASFVIKESNKDEHWIPGFKRDCLLLDLMESLINHKFLEARGTRFGIAKKIFFKRASDAVKKRLPRIRAYPAEKPEQKTERVFAFVGWRFPSPMDSFEMDSVEHWLQRHESKLRVDVSEAKQVCFDMFSRYVRRPQRFMFVGYPPSNTPDRSSPPSEPPQGVLDHTSGHDIDVANDNESTIQNRSNVRSSELHLSTAQQTSEDALISGSRELMKVASTDFYYRSLLLILNPACEVRLDAACFAWMQQFKDGKPQEEWCGLMKDIFQYCRLVAKRDTTSSLYRQLKADLTQELASFKLIRSSAGLPLFEGSTSLIEQAFDRRETI